MCQIGDTMRARPSIPSCSMIFRENGRRNISYSAMWRAAEFRVSHVPGRFAETNQLFVSHSSNPGPKVFNGPREFVKRYTPLVFLPIARLFL